MAVLKAHSATPLPDPVIFLNGGPGDSALDGVPYWRTSPLRDRRDFILLDQRGTGYSQPSLACPEFVEFDRQTQDKNLSPEEEVALDVQAATKCRDHPVGEGVNLQAYHSAENASDLNDLRLALGYQEWNLYGISYGARLALITMRDHPEGIRSVILDSVRPPQANDFELCAGNTARAFSVLFDGCAADPACRTAYPDLEKVFYELVNRLNANPVMVSVPDPQTGSLSQQLVTGDDLIDGLYTALYHTDLIPFLPLAGYQIQAGNSNALAGMAVLARRNPNSFSIGMHISVLCYEEWPFNDPQQVRDSWELYPQLQGYLMRNPVPAECAVWGAGEAGPIETEPVHSDIPALVLAGEYDPINSSAWGKLAAETLGRSFYYEFPGIGHAASFGECQGHILYSFVNNSTVAPDASCVAEMKGPAFVTDLYLNGGIYKVATDLLLKPDPLQVGGIGFCMLLFFSTVIGWPVDYLNAGRRNQAVQTTRLANIARWMAGLVAVFNLVFFISLTILSLRLNFANPNILLFGLPSAATPLFVLPPLTAVLTVGLLALTGLAWKNRYWSLSGRVHYSLVLLAALVFIWFSNHWSLLHL